MKRGLFLLICLIFVVQFAKAGDWAIADFAVNTVDIERGVKEMQAKTGLAPAGIDVTNNRAYLQFIRPQILGMTEWKIEKFPSIADYQSAIERYVKNGMTPIDFTIAPDSVYGLFLRTKMNIEAWRCIDVGQEPNELPDAIQKYRAMKYIAVGITGGHQKRTHLLMIKPKNYKMERWAMEAYKTSDREIKAEVQKYLDRGFAPLGLLVGSTKDKVRNICMVKFAELPKPVSFNTNVLLSEVNDFMELLRQSPGNAALIYMNPPAQLSFAGINTLCGPALKYFAQGMLPLICPLDSESAMVGFYHPWADAMILTEWGANANGAEIRELEFVTGDFIRNSGEPPFYSPPEWRQPGKGVAPETIRKLTLETAKAFNELFRAARPEGAWRKELQPLSNAEMLTTNAALASLNIAGIVKRFHGLIKNPDLKALSEQIAKTMTGLQNRKLDQIIKDGANIKSSNAKFLREFPSAYWSQSQIMDVVAARSGAIVFLNVPGSPWLFASLLFDSSRSGFKLQRIDILDLPGFPIAQ